jgi:hypothetical protein
MPPKEKVNLWDTERREWEREKAIPYTCYQIREFNKMLFGRHYDQQFKKYEEYTYGRIPWWTLPLLIFVLYVIIIAGVVFSMM